MRLKVSTQLQKDYDESLDEWVKLLSSLNKVNSNLVSFDH